MRLVADTGASQWATWLLPLTYRGDSRLDGGLGHPPDVYMTVGHAINTKGSIQRHIWGIQIKKMASASYTFLGFSLGHPQVIASHYPHAKIDPQIKWHIHLTTNWKQIVYSRPVGPVHLARSHASILCCMLPISAMWKVAMPTNHSTFTVSTYYYTA